MNLYIDTNIYLKFYHFTNDELEELRKLIVLMSDGQINLFLPEQVMNEFKRNREVKIADALKRFNEDRLNTAIPVFCKEYEEYKEINKAISDYNDSKKKLLQKVSVAIYDNTLKADEVIQELFSKSNLISFSDKIIYNAKFRYDLGNPPGKNNSYGDAINWVSLLEDCDDRVDLYFLSDDKDYFSEINNKDFNKFLESEWRENKKSKIIFYKSISEFFKDKFPDIKLATELQKDIVINKLSTSGSYVTSRSCLHKLYYLNDFNSDQINRIFDASTINGQIYRLGEDSDINKILYKWYDDYEGIITDEIKTRFKEKIKRCSNEDAVIPDEDEFDEPLPF